jgi:hypothetical protein
MTQAPDFPSHAPRSGPETEKRTRRASPHSPADRREATAKSIPQQQTFAQTAEALVSLINPRAKDDPSTAFDSLAARLRAAAGRLALAPSRKGLAITREAREAFLILVGAGVGIDLAAQIAGPTPSTFYNLRRRDPDFRRSWEEARELSLDAIHDRLYEIGMSGKPDSMATVRALEILERARDPRQQRSPSVTLASTDDDGRPRAITFRMNTPLPD